MVAPAAGVRTMVNKRAELKRLARRIAKTYDHTLGEWDNADWWNDNESLWNECVDCHASLAIHLLVPFIHYEKKIPL